MATPINENVLRQLFTNRQYVQIAKMAKPAEKKFPRNPVVMTILGFSFAQLGNLEQAIHFFEKNVTLNPKSAEAHNNLANALLNYGETYLALQSFERAIALNSTYDIALFGKAAALAGLNRTQEAIDGYRQAIAIQPNRPKWQVALGEAHQSLGEFDEARSQFQKALDLDRQYAQAHYSVAAVTKYKDAADEHMKEMGRQLNHPNTNLTQKVFLNFGLGKAYADCKDYDRAFEHWQKANTMHKSTSGYQFAIHKDVFDKIPTICADLPDIDQDNPTDKAPIFIVGMPRSGTSLVEQILSGHSKVTAAGELDYIGHGVNRYLWNRGAVTKAKLIAVRDYYIKRLGEINIDTPIFTDKMPTNFRWIGLIKTLFPKARFVHLNRHPMAICFSNYRNYFPSSGMSYTYDQQDVADFYLSYDALMKHWNETCGDSIIRVDYARLTEDPRGETEALLEKLGFDWEESCLNIEDNKRAIRTASNTQIRGKIYSGSSEEWKNYEKFLSPMLTKLEPVLKEQNWPL
ncbi:MAG: tetratricopeptide repeat-containing sulfotransferase family protein [Candidatus Puniceispirillales bacterium]